MRRLRDGGDDQARKGRDKQGNAPADDKRESGQHGASERIFIPVRVASYADADVRTLVDEHRLGLGVIDDIGHLVRSEVGVDRAVVQPGKLATPGDFEELGPVRQDQGHTVTGAQPGAVQHRGDALAAGASYPALTLTVAVSSTAPSSVTNSVSGS